MDKDAKIAKRRSQIPKLYRGIYDKAMRGRSLKTAVHAFCLICVGGVRNEVTLCTDTACPLYPYRPYQKIPWKAHKGHKPSKSSFFSGAHAVSKAVE